MAVETFTIRTVSGSIFILNLGVQMIGTFVLVLVWGNTSAITSQTITGFSSKAACEAAGAAVRTELYLARMACVEVK
jgi:hypothetical protein